MHHEVCPAVAPVDSAGVQLLSSILVFLLSRPCAKSSSCSSISTSNGLHVCPAWSPALLQQVAVEVLHDDGLIVPPEVSRGAVSGLLLLLQALKLQGFLTVQQEELLRHLTCQHDTRLLRAYEEVWDFVICNRTVVHVGTVLSSCATCQDCMAVQPLLSSAAETGTGQE